jgi:hypothetical protein
MSESINNFTEWVQGQSKLSTTESSPNVQIFKKI